MNMMKNFPVFDDRPTIYMVSVFTSKTSIISKKALSYMKKWNVIFFWEKNLLKERNSYDDVLLRPKKINKF